MLGVAVFGSSLEESVQFDSLAYSSAPVLGIQMMGDTQVLSWLAGFADYTLQSCPNLNQPGRLDPGP